MTIPPFPLRFVCLGIDPAKFVEAFSRVVDLIPSRIELFRKWIKWKHQVTVSDWPRFSDGKLILASYHAKEYYFYAPLVKVLSPKALEVLIAHELAHTFHENEGETWGVVEGWGFDREGLDLDVVGPCMEVVASCKVMGA